MMGRDDIRRELEAVVEAGLMKTREAFEGAGMSADELAITMASERRRLDSWLEQTLDWVMHQAAEPPSPQGAVVTSERRVPVGVIRQ